MSLGTRLVFSIYISWNSLLSILSNKMMFIVSFSCSFGSAHSMKCLFFYGLLISLFLSIKISSISTFLLIRRYLCVFLLRLSIRGATLGALQSGQPHLFMRLSNPISPIIITNNNVCCTKRPECKHFFH